MSASLMSRKSQSAMEYLMTYGWAILIIAVILGALYQVGVFNPYTFSPKVGAGACKVARGIVDGQVTSSKVGTCNNALPQYVAQFDGSTGYVSISKTGSLTALEAGGSLTVTAWIYYTGGASCKGILGDWPDPGNGFELLASGPNGACSDFYVCGASCGGMNWPAGYSNFPDGAWEMVAGTYNYTTGAAAVYLNGQVFSSASYGSGLVLTQSSPLRLGNIGWGTGIFVGSMANVQLYNASLTQNAINALYLEGIGAAPSNIQNLVAWWPLNGDFRDYSGNGNDGSVVTGGVTFTGSWYNSYVSPK